MAEIAPTVAEAGVKPSSLIAVPLLAACAVPALAQTFQSSTGPLRVQTVAVDLARPWGLAFLPDGRMLVTEKAGRLRIVGKDGRLSPPVAGMPQVAANGQGGLLDVAVDRNDPGIIYFCYAEPVDGGARTTLARARLVNASPPRLEDVRAIFRQRGPLARGYHYGCRIVQASDGNLFLTLGDHFAYRDEAQNLANHLGKIVRIRPDGSAPPDNPFVNRRGAAPEIYSYGHRNAQGAALHPVSGKLWMHEHGPRGGDEVNVIEPGRNYGWPVIGYGVDYNGARIHESTHRPGMEQPIKQWTPVIAPSGMAFYQGDLWPAWKGSLFIGGLVARALVRLDLEGEQVVREERLLRELNERIRDVRTGPDGALYVLTDSTAGRILRITPAE